MRSTGIFTVRKFYIKIEKLNEPIYILPFGDVHKYAPAHADERWADFLEWARNKNRAYFLGMGDYADFVSSSERDAIKTGKFHESTIQTIEELYETHLRGIYRDIEFARGRCIGLLEGNHYAEFRDGTTSTQRLCGLLNCDYLGVSAFVRLMLRYGGHSCAVDIWAHHGKGAARLIGGSLNTVQQMGEQAEADIYLMAHDHKKSIGMTSKLKLTSGGGNVSLVHRKQIYARCGSFLRGYVPDMPTYIADKNLNPTDMGIVKIELTPKRAQSESLWV